MDEYHDGRPTDTDDYGQDYEAQAHSLTEIDPDELATFGEVLDYWTMRGGMTDSERTAFWTGWARLTIAWTLGMAGALVLSEFSSGIISDIGLILTIYAGFALAWQVVDAVRFAVRGRQGR
jgi:hypothetical protein